MHINKRAAAAAAVNAASKGECIATRILVLVSKVRCQLIRPRHVKPRKMFRSGKCCMERATELVATDVEDRQNWKS